MNKLITISSALLTAAAVKAQTPNIVFILADDLEMCIRDRDRSEQHDLAAKYPEKVAEMSKAYEAWAKRCMVEPYPGQKKK